MRPCREASIGLIAFDIADNTGLTGKDSVVANGDVARAACLSGKDDVIAGLGATGNAGLGNDKAVFPDFDVMAEVDQVVDFSAPADLGRTESGIVQAGAGPDFDIVSEDDIADLGDAGMLPCFRGKSEAFNADDVMGPDDGIFPEDAVFMDDGAGIKNGSFADFDMVA